VPDDLYAPVTERSLVQNIGSTIRGTVVNKNQLVQEIGPAENFQNIPDIPFFIVYGYDRGGYWFALLNGLCMGHGFVRSPFPILNDNDMNRKPAMDCLE
jgi:hypothetical protein